ncbi:MULTISPECIES: YodL domain-containing protein [Lachnospiraceae]|uniref:DNA repair protein n=1 Tax=Enterocloster clostridioformis TaxID=1531 RepID=A0A2X2USV2_9FIRM|nr:YodL domain-containing protein [Enterocloster clostridioformis]MCA5576002.1 ssDNA-binding domain-containing protein [Enterocloster clostridioformis]SQB16003.1 DNA repair protein [Enterocloster clostridioformis]
MADERTEKQKVQEITDKLEEGLKELFESEKYKTYLSTMSKFHNYSFNNTLLIAMQKPEATLVAGYKAWQKNFERHVNKGEKAIRILAPAPYKIKEERDKLDPVTGEMMFDENGMPQKEQVEVTIPAFRAVSVFDVSQTDGKPIPELEAQELLSTVEGYEDFVQALMNVAPVPIGFEDIPGDSKGYFHTEEKRIAVQENMSESQTLKTMVHEVAHSMLHNKEINRDDLMEVPAKDRNTKEVEAESVAYTVCQHFGIDTSDYSFGYIAGWSSGKDMKELKSSLDTIRKTASELITGIEGALQELQLNRAIEKEQSKECILLIQNEDLTEFSLVNVRGMDTQELVAALTNMSEDDKLSIQAYLESKGAWTTELGNEKSREFEEYHLDVRYNFDTDEITDVKAKMTEQIDSNLSVMGQAEKLINQLEAEKTIFTSDESNLIVNYAYKLDDMNKTRELAEKLAYQLEYAQQDVGLTIIDAQAEIDALPDPMIGLSEMREYGYTWNEMLPLTQEKALELFDHDLPVYLLHNDGSETTVEDRKQITEHEGIFGIEKGDWENERKLRSMQAELSDNEINKEAKLLYGSSDKYGIYQLKHNPELDHLRFEGTESLKRMGITKDNFDAIKPENYELIYVGNLSELQEQTEGEMLEAIYEKFNIDHPEDYRGHSLSVSDIVVLHQNGKNSAHFVDSFGFTGLSDFMQTLEGVKEQEAEIDTSGQDVQKSEPEKQELETSDNTLEDGDEIIDLGDEKEQVLADMKKSLEIGEETELAFQIADRYISIQEVDGGYDYSIMGADYKEIDGGVYDNPDVTIREALTDIIDDLKSAPDHNGAKGSIKEKDELIPIDYDGLMEKVEEANEVVPKNQESSIIADFRAKTNEMFHDISEMNPAEIEETIKCHVQAKIDEYDIDATIIDAVVVGSRCRGLEKDSSDLDVVVELSTNEREDDLFNAFNEDGLHIGEVKVDINPITAQRTGTLETYLPQAEKYLESIRQEREQELTQQMHTQGEMKKEEVEVTLMVSECGEFHNLGEFYENIPTVEEAIAIWKQIPPEQMHGIPAIGINVHRPGEENYMDDEVDLLSGNRIDLEILEHIPSITGEPKAMEVIAELVAKLPEMEIDGVMSEDMEAKVWEKRMPDLTPAEQLAVEIDRFSHDYDIYSYRNNNPNMTESVSEISEMIVQGNTEPITDWLNEVISEGALPDEMQRAKVLLEKLAEYKPLAKIEEMEEQNYNMIDNVLNNGAEKAQREANKKNQEQSAVKVSLKARLAEKKAQVEGCGQEHEVQENTKKNQREI